MQLVDRAILTEMCGLSFGVVLVGMLIGVALWLFGWWGHRFWVVLAATVGAGVYGLCQGETYKTHPLAAGVLFALAGGMLALALVRVFAFLAGGYLGLSIAQWLAPSFEQQVVPFLLCGLVGLLLFRPSIMLLTSLAGSMALAHGGLALVHRQGSLDAPAWLDQGTTLANWIIAVMTLVGFVFQYVHDRRSGAKKEKKEKKKRRSRDDD